MTNDKPVDDKALLDATPEVAMIIKKRLKDFWGYGNLKGSVWFVGMEEGLDTSEGFPLERFRATADKAVADITTNFSSAHSALFKPNAPTQPTFRRLIFILLYQKLGRIPSIAEIRDFQINHFGRTKSEHALLELMPLPAKSTRKADWIYQDIPLIGLTNREEYLANYLPERVEALSLLIEKYQPKLVVFYSRSYLETWQTIIPKKLKEVIPNKLHTVKVCDTIFAVTPHPTYKGLTTADRTEISKHLS